MRGFCKTAHSERQARFSGLEKGEVRLQNTCGVISERCKVRKNR